MPGVGVLGLFGIALQSIAVIGVWIAAADTAIKVAKAGRTSPPQPAAPGS